MLLQNATSKLATAQGKNLQNYGKIKFQLQPTKTTENYKLLKTFFTDIIYITSKKPNIIGALFITKNIPTVNIECRLQI